MGCQNSVQAKEKPPLPPSSVLPTVVGTTIQTPAAIPSLSMSNLKQHEDLYDTLESARREALVRKALNQRHPHHTPLAASHALASEAPQAGGVEDDWLRRTSAAAMKRHIRLQEEYNNNNTHRRTSKSPKAMPPVSLSPLTPSILRSSEDGGSSKRGGCNASSYRTPGDKCVKFAAALLVSPTTAESTSGSRSRMCSSPSFVAAGHVTNVSDMDGCTLLALSPISPPPLLLSKPMESTTISDDDDYPTQRGLGSDTTPQASRRGGGEVGMASVQLSSIYSPEYSNVVNRKKNLLEVRMEDRALGLENSPHHLSTSEASPSPRMTKHEGLSYGNNNNRASTTSSGETQGISRSPSSVAVVPASISPATTTADRDVSNSPTFYTVHSMAPSVSRCLDNRSESASPRTNRVPLSAINPIQSYFPVIPQGGDAVTPPNAHKIKKKDKKSPVVPVDFNPLSNLDFGRGAGLLAPKVGGGAPRNERDIIRQLLSSYSTHTAIGGVNPIEMKPHSLMKNPSGVQSRKASRSASGGSHSLPPPAVTFQQEQEALRQVAVEASGLSKDSLRMKRAIQRMYFSQYNAASSSSSPSVMYLGIDEDDQDSIRCGSVATANGSYKATGKGSLKRNTVEKPSRAGSIVADGVESCASFVTVRTNHGGVPAVGGTKISKKRAGSVCVSEMGGAESTSSIFLTTNCSTNAHLRNLRRRVTLTGSGMLFTKL